MGLGWEGKGREGMGWDGLGLHRVVDVTASIGTGLWPNSEPIAGRSLPASIPADGGGVGTAPGAHAHVYSKGRR